MKKRMRGCQATVDELQELRAACKQEPALEVYVAADLQALDEALRGIGSAAERQKTLTVQRLQATRNLRAHLAKARDLRTTIQCAVVAFFGPRSEKLSRFRIGLWKRRSRAAVPKSTPCAGRS